MVKKQTVLTLEAFQEVVMPQINGMFKDLKKKINHLPTKEEYYKREDKTMNELRKLREEVEVVNHQYKRTNKRVDLIDKHLGINTSSVAI